MSAETADWSAACDLGILLVGHGSREEASRGEFDTLARRVMQHHPGVPVASGFLEFWQPDIGGAFQQLIDQGVRRVVAVPVLLFAAGHAKQDIPAALARAAATRGDVAFRQAGHLGCHPAMVELSRQRFLEALDRSGTAPSPPALILAGRGSHDTEATAEFHRYHELCRAACGVELAAGGFLAMAEPRLSDVLDAAAGWNRSPVVVLPHLLFDGVLAQRVDQLVAQCRQQYPQARWLLAAYLGPVELVARALHERIEETIQGRPACVT
jgi:sirohydrochlorin ferrochelatase